MEAGVEEQKVEAGVEEQRLEVSKAEAWKGEPTELI